MVCDAFRISALCDSMDLLRHDELLLLDNLEVSDNIDSSLWGDEGKLVELAVFEELVGDLYDALLLDGCERIIEYAREKGKPSVINMSIADYTGPHDGTTLFNQYMKMLCEDASICISAGNDAYRDGHILKTFSGSDTRLKS